MVNLACLSAVLGSEVEGVEKGEHDDDVGDSGEVGVEGSSDTKSTGRSTKELVFGRQVAVFICCCMAFNQWLWFNIVRIALLKY